MIEIIGTEEHRITDQEAAEAVDTIRRYCNEHRCGACVIEQICEECFCSFRPEDWSEVDLPETRRKSHEGLS